MPSVQGTNDETVFTEKIPNGLRIFLFAIGVIPAFVVPYKFLQPYWGQFGLSYMFLLVLSLGALALGGMFMLAGLVGLNQTLRVNLTPPTIHMLTNRRSGLCAGKPITLATS